MLKVHVLTMIVALVDYATSQLMVKYLLSIQQVQSVFKVPTLMANIAKGWAFNAKGSNGINLVGGSGGDVAILSGTGDGGKSFTSNIDF